MKKLDFEVVMTEKAATNIHKVREVGVVLDAWKKGRFGTLVDEFSGWEMRPATYHEALESAEKGVWGTIVVDGEKCYVEPPDIDDAF